MVSYSFDLRICASGMNRLLLDHRRLSPTGAREHDHVEGWLPCPSKDSRRRGRLSSKDFPAKIDGAR